MARYMRTDLSAGHSKLKPPAVVGEGIVYPPIQGYLFNVGRPAGIIRCGNITSVLRPPVVVTPAAPFVASPVTVKLAPSTRIPRAAHSRLRPPVVIDLTPQTKYLSVNLTYSRRGVPKSVLRPPLDTVGLEDQGRVETRLAPSPTQARRAHPRLSPPTVIDLTPQTKYLSVNLAYSRRGAPKSRLEPPTVVATPAVFYGPRTCLVSLRTPANLVRQRTMAGVRAPVFIGPGVYFRGILTHLAPSSRGRPFSRLVAPQVVATTQVFSAAKPALVRITPRRVEPTLRPPQVVYLAVEIYGPTVKVAYSVRKRGAAELKPPALIDLSPQVYYLTVWLTRNKPQPTTKFLSPPTDLVDEQDKGRVRVTLTRIRPVRTAARVEPPVVVFLAVEIYGPKVTLARIRPVPTVKRLQPPTVVDTRVYFGPAVQLTYSRRGTPVSALQPPTVIDLSPQTVYLTVWLTYSRRGRPVSRLGPPAVVAHEGFFGPDVHLTYSRHGAPRSTLRPPTVIDLRPQVYYLSVSLTRITPPPVLSRLIPPTTTEALPRAERDIRVTLAYQSRGRPKSVLRKPVVIDLRPQVYYLTVTLAYSRRGKPKSKLSFTAGQRVVFFGPQTTLTYSVRGRPESRLSGPVVVRVFVAPAAMVHLAYSRRGRPVYKLRPPTRVFPFVARPTDVTLTYSVRGKPKSSLVPPTVVRVRENQPTRVTLTRIVPAPTVALLRPPTVVRVPENLRTRVTFAYQSRGVPRYRLQPPTVVFPAPLARAIDVTLVRIFPPERFWLLRPPAVVGTFVPPAGEVCDFTSTDTEVCDDTSSTDEVCDTTETTSVVVGSDTTESRITDGDTAVDTVCDSNEKAT